MHGSNDVVLGGNDVVLVCSAQVTTRKNQNSTFLLMICMRSLTRNSYTYIVLLVYIHKNYDLAYHLGTGRIQQRLWCVLEVVVQLDA